MKTPVTNFVHDAIGALLRRTPLFRPHPGGVRAGITAGVITLMLPVFLVTLAMDSALFFAEGVGRLCCDYVETLQHLSGGKGA